VCFPYTIDRFLGSLAQLITYVKENFIVSQFIYKHIPDHPADPHPYKGADSRPVDRPLICTGEQASEEQDSRPPMEPRGWKPTRWNQQDADPDPGNASAAPGGIK
jgi:hypothetical protein